MKVLMVGLDRTVYEGNKRGDFLSRLKKYAKLVNHITYITYTPNKDYKVKVFGNIKIVPTNNNHPVFFGMNGSTLAENENFDLVVTQDTEACGEVGRRIKTKFKVPLVCNMFTVKPSNEVMNWISKRVIKNADLIRCESKVQESLLRKQGYKGKVVIAPIGFDLDKFRPPKKRKANNTVLFVGRLSPEKNVELLLQAAEVLQETKFVIIGDGEPKYVASLHEQGGDNVQFKGLVPHDKLKKYYDNANLLVLTSKYEGLPTVLVEAMSNALPVVTTDFPDAHQIVDNGTTGYIVSQNNLRGLIKCIEALTSFSNMAERMGQAGYVKVHKEYGKDITKKVVEGWRSVLKNRTGCPDKNDHVDYCKWCNK